MAKWLFAAIFLVPSVASAQVTHDNGFVWKTEDGEHQLKLGGYVQGRWAGTFVDGDLASGGFLFRRARTTLEAKLGSQLSFRTMLEWSSQPLLLDLYGDWKLTDTVKIRVGRDKVPFTRTFLGSASQLTFAERPVVVDAQRWARDIGVQVRHDGAKLTAQAGIGNGAIDGAVDKYPSGAARVQVAALGDVLPYGGGDVKRIDTPSVTVGADAIVDSVPVPATIGAIDVVTGGRVDVIAASGDVTFRYRGLEVLGEVLYRIEDWAGIFPDNPELADLIGEETPSYLGVYGEATYMVIPELMVGGRVGWGELPVLSMRGASAVPRGPEALELSALVLLFHEGKRALGATYSMVDFSEDGGTEHRAFLEAQLTL